MSYKSHMSFGKQLLRALLGIILAAGSGMFWFSLICGIERFVVFFIVGIISIVIALAHLFIVIAKQVRYNRY